MNHYYVEVVKHYQTYWQHNVGEGGGGWAGALLSLTIIRLEGNVSEQQFISVAMLKLLW